jgi:hypothetical protein
MTLDQFQRPEDIIALLPFISRDPTLLGKLDPAIQKIIKDMQAQGVNFDKLDDVQAYFAAHPRIMDGIAKANGSKIEAAAGRATTEVVAERVAARAEVVQGASPAPTPQTAPVASTRTPRALRSDL